MKKFIIVVAGATGLVGRTMLRVLEERAFPVAELIPVASERSAGREIPFLDRKVTVRAMSEEVFKGADIVLGATSASNAAQWVPVARKHAGVVIDNSSYYRLHDDIPLVVPEVNPDDVRGYGVNLIANPNCSTIQMVVALKPIHDIYTIRRIVVSTYQAVSGAGQKGVDQFLAEQGGDYSARAFPFPVTKNPLPHIADFAENGLTKEENKMIAETRKIMHDDRLRLAPTCVRVPVMNCHSESVNLELEREFTVEDIRALLAQSPGIVVKDNPGALEYPLVTDADDRDEVFVGRIRRDDSVPNGLAMWVVADNLRKGAATNAVQIAEIWAGIERVANPLRTAAAGGI